MPSTVRKVCLWFLKLSLHGKEIIEFVFHSMEVGDGDCIKNVIDIPAVVAKGIHWLKDFFPTFGAVPFFAIPVRHEAGTETEHTSVEGYVRRIL